MCLDPQHLRPQQDPPVLSSPCPAQLARVLPGSLPLELRVRAVSKPVLAMRGARATATLKAFVDVISPALRSSLFSLDTVSGSWGRRPLASQGDA